VSTLVTAVPAPLAAVVPRVAPPLRVCHVMSADLWAGAEVQLATTAAYLAAQPDMQLSIVLFNEGRLARELRELGVSVTVFDETRLGGLAILSRLTQWLAARPVDVVHTHRYKDTVIGATAARLTGVPHLVRTVHGFPEPTRGWNALKLHAYELLDRAALRRSSAVLIAVSKNLAEALRRSGFWAGRVTAIHNGMAAVPEVSNEIKTAVRRELGVPDEALLIGTVGRLAPVKGHVDLIRAIALARPRIPQAKLLIAGEGPLHGELSAMASRLGIADCCIFSGHRDDVHHLTAAMDIFVLPSLSEGIPMALLEAMSLGVPVIATRVGGMPEVVHDRVTGLLVPPGDDRALAEACLELAANPIWAADLAAAGRQFVVLEHSRERAGRALADTYRSLCRVRDVRRRRTVLALLARLVAYPARLVRRVVERERMRQIRRDPAELTRALAAASRIMVVCQGNIIRSPLAAALIQRALGSGGLVTVRSAGLGATAGRTSPLHAVTIAADARIDLTGHTATPLTASAVADSDVIFVMDVRQLIEAGARFPDARPKLYLLACLSPDMPLDVRDPVDGDLSDFRACFIHINAAVAPIARVLSEARVCR